MIDRDELLDLIEQAIDDSFDVDWTSRDGARAVMDMLWREGLLPLNADEQLMLEGAWQKHKAAGPHCAIPPEGWFCSRGAGHEGPCAAHRIADKYKEFTDGMEAAAQICGSLAETTYDDADAFEAATGCEAAIMAVVREQRIEQLLTADACPTFEAREDGA